jgi:hypothetical protein
MMTEIAASRLESRGIRKMRMDAEYVGTMQRWAQVQKENQITQQETGIQLFETH